MSGGGVSARRCSLIFVILHRVAVRPTDSGPKRVSFVGGEFVVALQKHRNHFLNHEFVGFA